MGYCIQITGCDLRVPKERLPDLLAALKEEWEPDEEGAVPSMRWVSSEAIQAATTLRQVLDEWRWEPYYDTNGDLVELIFQGEKLGDDANLMATIAPFADHGGYIEVRGEDDCMWRWVFWRGQLREEFPKVIWEYETMTAVSELMEGVNLE